MLTDLRVAAGLFTALLLVSGGCGKGSPTPEAGSGSSSVATDSVSALPGPLEQLLDRLPSSDLMAPWQMDKPVNVAHVYIDLSGSMRGFSRQTGSPTHRLAQEVRAAFFKQGISRTLGAGFGESVEGLRDVAGMVETIGWPASETSTCLSLPLQDEVELLSSGENPALLLVVSDGVASATKSGCGANCEEGNDVACIAGSALRYVRRGMGLWVVALKLPFAGYYYPEACEGSSIAVPSGTSRPLFLWIGSPNFEVGEEVVEELLEWGNTQGYETLGVRVWPGSWSGFVPAQGGKWGARDFVSSGDAQRRCVSENPMQLQSVDTASSVPRIELSRAGRGQGSRGLWAGAVPIRWNGVAVEDRATLLRLEHRDPLQVEGCVVRYLSEDVGENATSVDVCLEPREATFCAYIDWSARVDLSILQNWTTRDDCDVGELDRTLNLEELWELVSHRLKVEVNRDLISPVIVGTVR